MVKVAVVGGEGIGPEVTAQSRRVLDWFAAKRGVPMTLREAQYGLDPVSRRPARCCRRTPPRRWTRPTRSCGRDRRPGDQRSAGGRAQGRQSARACAANTISTPICGRSWRSPALSASAPLKRRGARRRRFRHHPRIDQRHLFRRAARHRDACRMASAAASTPSNTPPTRSAAWRARPSSWRGRGATRSARSTRPMCWRPAWCGARR